jgi:FGFR1 oncogene partner
MEWFYVLEFLLLAGRLLTTLVCEYLEWAQLSHTMKVYLPECNLVSSDCSCHILFVHFGNQHPLMFPVSFVNQPKDFWKNELKDFSNKSGAEGSRSAESGPMLLDVLEGYQEASYYKWNSKQMT